MVSKQTKISTQSMENKIAPKTLDNSELNKFLLWLSQPRPHRHQERNDHRNFCMALLMVDAGLRVGEVVKLLQSDLAISDLPVKKLTITSEISKSKSDRMVPLSLRCQAAIDKLRDYVWIYTSMDPPLFAFYTRSHHVPITVRQVERIFKSAGMKSIGRPINPHMLRHTFGSKMMRVTNAAIVQELLGHKHLSSTQVYMHPNGDDLQSAIDTLNS